MSDWLVVAATLPSRLREAAAMAWGALGSGEAYPFAGALGPVSDDGTEALRSWVLARYPAGFTRDEFAAAWGPPAGEALMGVLAELRAIGVVDVGDAGVRFFPGVGADVAVHAVLLWSEAVRAAARRAWGVGDGGERGRLDRAVAYVE
jgi:hypothetical protein